MPQIYIAALWVGLSAVAAALAAVRGHSGPLVFVMSMVASPFFALPVILLTPRPAAPPEADLGTLPSIVTCAHCTGKVVRTAACCLHCGAELPAARVVVAFPVRQASVGRS